MLKRITAAQYFDYETVPLKLYLDISEGYQVEKLCHTGKADIERCYEIFEEIIKQHSRKTGNAEYFGFFKTFKEHQLMVNEWTIVSAILLRLSPAGGGFDQRWVDELNKRRYSIKTTSVQEYNECMERATGRVNNLATQILLKKKELDDYQPKKGKKEVKQSFESLMASLCEGLGREVPDTITLARYDEYCRIIKIKRRPKKSPYDR